LAEKDRKVRKPNYIQTMYRETIGELRKVSWPTGPEARRLTVLVLVVMIVMGAILGTVDALGQRSVTFLLGIN
jgi:preprotein translocase subunit SecE